MYADTPVCTYLRLLRDRLSQKIGKSLSKLPSRPVVLLHSKEAEEDKEGNDDDEEGEETRISAAMTASTPSL